MSFIDRSLSSDKRKRCHELGYVGDGRRVPFKQTEMAELAGDNVIESGVEIAEITDLTVELIRSFGAKRSAKIWRKIQRLARRVRRRQLGAAVSGAAPWDGNVLSLTRYFETQLSPAGDRRVLYQMPSTLGLAPPLLCAAEICKLPAQIRESLVRLDISSLAAALARSIVDRRSIEPLLKTVWKYRLVAVAQRRGLALADAAREPNGFRVAGPQASPSTGHLFLRTVTAPAMVVNGIDALLQTIPLPEDDDQAAINALISHGLVTEHHAPILWKAGCTVRHRVRMDARAGMTIDVLNCLTYLAKGNGPVKGARSAAMLVYGDMKKDVLDRQEPIDHLLGLTGAEATAFIAEQLVLACEAVDASPWAILPEGRSDRRAPVRPLERQVGIVANILAYENGSYRYASGTRGVRDPSKHDPLAPTHKPMRGAVIAMRRKLGGRLRDRQVRRFGIDPYAYLA